MPYAIAHFRKVRNAAALTAVVKHNQRTTAYREGRTPPGYITHPERAELNVFGPYKDQTPASVHALRKNIIEGAQLARKPQKNAAVAIEGVFTASPEWFAAHPRTDWKGFFKDTGAFLARYFGRQTILHVAHHFDEKTPHIHVLFVPIVISEHVRKYSSSAFLGGREGLRRFQTDFAKEVGAAYGLGRGIEGSKARHTDQAEWAAEKRRLREKAALLEGSQGLQR